jgi:hypothetical protein
MTLGMQLTLRELERFRVPLLIWATLSIVAAVAGPFGTLNALGVGGRFVYWGAVVGCSVGLSIGATILATRVSQYGRVIAWSGFVLLLSTTVHVINSFFFSEMKGWENWLYLLAVVALVTTAVQLLILVIKPTPGAEVEVQDTFMLRLPIETRAALVRIEAQDHYLSVVTARGTALILMRLSDAISEVSGRGIQVHRSHWIATDAVTRHRRDKGRDVLEMSDGTDIPVSRSFRETAQKAGLF